MQIKCVNKVNPAHFAFVNLAVQGDMEFAAFTVNRVALRY